MSTVSIAGVAARACFVWGSARKRLALAGKSPFALPGSIGTAPPLIDAIATEAPASRKMAYGVVSSSSQRPVGLPASPITAWEVVTMRMEGILTPCIADGQLQ